MPLVCGTFKAVRIALDQLLNAFCEDWPDETLFFPRLALGPVRQADIAGEGH
ncbi:MAG: hypothetical protein LBB52_02830 [Desulfovibrio sp.]|nr:hypothetical protein [Desulfovibrio sp.]